MMECVHLLQIREEFKQFGINIYQFPDCDSDEDEDFKRQDRILKVLEFTVSSLMAQMCYLINWRFVFCASLCRKASRSQ